MSHSTTDGDVPATKIIPYPFSPSSEPDTLALIDDVLNAWGRLDVWVCSSGLLGPASIDKTTPENLQQVWQTNALAPFFALKYAPPAMGKKCEKRHYANASEKDRAYGSIVVVGSVASEYGGCWGPCYTMSAHAALGVVRAGVAVLRGTGVRINCISPGQIDSGIDLKGFDMRGLQSQLPPANLQSEEVSLVIVSGAIEMVLIRVPQSQKEHIGLARAGLPTEVARVAGFLASGFSSYMTGMSALMPGFDPADHDLSGANMVVDGGASVMCPLTVPI